MKDVVEVWGKIYEIDLIQHSKTVWWAIGDYEGRILRVKGRTANAAAKGWCDVARYRGSA